jgi:diacylglycerol kinase family enzyme
MLTSSGVRGRKTVRFTDVSEFRLVADEPVHLQVDGDYLGEIESAHLRSVPRALEVIA